MEKFGDFLTWKSWKKFFGLLVWKEKMIFHT